MSEAPARRVPSAQECRFCEISSADCPERVEDEVAQSDTVHPALLKVEAADTANAA